MTKEEKALETLKKMRNAHISIEDMIIAVEMFSRNKRTENAEQISIEKQLRILFRDLGVPTNILGRKYLLCAIPLAYRDANYLDQILSLYEATAKEYGVTAQKVERAMRHSIERTFNNGNIDLLNKIFGYTISGNKGKATNSELISAIVDYLKMQNEA